MLSSNSTQGLLLVASELVDHICSFVDRPKDLLSFALTSKQVYNVVIPDHIEFRHLRCDFRRISIWRKLATLPAVASRFVSLEIIVEDGRSGNNSIIPTRSVLLKDCGTTDGLLFSRYFFAEETLDKRYELECQPGPERRQLALQKCMHSFVAALRCMSGLTRFHWLIEQIPPSKELSVALLNCRAIEDVDIFSSHHWALKANPTVYGPWELSDLRAFSMDFKEEFNREVHQQYTASMIKMLDRCPRLEDLHLFPYRPTYLDTTQIFERGRWPSLKRFTLRCMDGLGDGVLKMFIEAHPKLERLYINTNNREVYDAKRVWTADLPNLKALHAGLLWDMRQIMTQNTMRNLEFLSVVNMGATPIMVADHLHILAKVPTLRSIVVHFPRPRPEYLGRFAEAVPSIQRLHF